MEEEEIDFDALGEELVGGEGLDEVEFVRVRNGEDEDEISVEYEEVEEGEENGSDGSFEMY